MAIEKTVIKAETLINDVLEDPMPTTALKGVRAYLAAALGVLAIATCLVAGEKKLDMPNGVRKAIARDFPQGTPVSIEKSGKGNFVVQIKSSVGTTTAKYDKKGNWVRTYVPIDIRGDSLDAKNCRALSTYIEPPGMMFCSSTSVANPSDSKTVVNPKGDLVSALKVLDGPGKSHFSLTISFCGRPYTVEVKDADR